MPFGNSFTDIRTESKSTNYRFTGKEQDAETGLYYYGARYYDPNVGRFLSVDPLADKFNSWSPYHYATNNPINVIDYDGRDTLPTTWKDWKKVGASMFTTIGHDLQASPRAALDMTVDGVEAVGTENVRKTGQTLNKIGDGASTIGYLFAVPTEGASLLIVPPAEAVSLVGKGLENLANFVEDGPTKDNFTNLVVDGLFELVPAPIENVIDKSGMDQIAKNATKTGLDTAKKIIEGNTKKALNDDPN